MPASEQRAESTRSNASASSVEISGCRAPTPPAPRRRAAPLPRAEPPSPPPPPDGGFFTLWEIADPLRAPPRALEDVSVWADRLSRRLVAPSQYSNTVDGRAAITQWSMSCTSPGIGSFLEAPAAQPDGEGELDDLIAFGELPPREVELLEAERGGDAAGRDAGPGGRLDWAARVQQWGGDPAAAPVNTHAAEMMRQLYGTVDLSSQPAGTKRGADDGDAPDKKRQRQQADCPDIEMVSAAYADLGSRTAAECELLEIGDLHRHVSSAMQLPVHSPSNVAGVLRRAAALYHRLHGHVAAKLRGTAPRMALYALLDSHQGIDSTSKMLHAGGDVRKKASQFVRDWLPLFLYFELFSLLVTPDGDLTAEGLQSTAAASPHCLHNLKTADVKKALGAACAKLDAAYLPLAAENRWSDGTSVLAVLVVANTLHIVSVGDSKCSLTKRKASGGLSHHFVSGKEHRPRQKQEGERVLKAGGAIRDGLVSGAVPVTRSMGDPELKRGRVLLPTPELFSYLPKAGEDLFLVLGPGRLWDLRQRAEVADWLCRRVSAEVLDVDLPDLDTPRERQRGGAPPAYDTPCGNHNLPRAARDLAREVTQQRQSAGTSDTAAVIIVTLSPFGVSV